MLGSAAAAQEGLRADLSGTSSIWSTRGALDFAAAVEQYVDGSWHGKDLQLVGGFPPKGAASTTLVIPADGSTVTFLDAHIIAVPIVISGVVDLGFDGMAPYELKLTTAEMIFEPIEASLSPDLRFQTGEVFASQNVRIAGTLTVNEELHSVDISSSFRPESSRFSQAAGPLKVAPDLSSIEWSLGGLIGEFHRDVAQDGLEEAVIFSALIAGHHVELALDLLFLATFFDPAAITAVADSDQDGRPDLTDNCPFLSNLDQKDMDNDGVGNACNDATDLDGDEFADLLDSCPDEFNPGQEDGDEDGVGDLCDPFPNDPDNDLAQCSSDVGDCQIDFIACESGAAQCSTDLSQAQAGLIACNGDLSSCVATATQLEADLLQTQGDLAQTQTDLSQAQGDITLLQADVTQLQSDLASTEAELTQTQADLEVATADNDEDGVRDTADACPDTTAGAKVDLAGCSQEQFCSAIQISGGPDKATCNSSDWMNDEPREESPEDCKAQRGACLPL
jgi:hypothetical protein